MVQAEYDMSEAEYNKRHKKALKDADPSYTEKKKPKKKKKEPKCTLRMEEPDEGWSGLV